MITRQQALQKNLKRYTGKPCHNCHKTLRCTINGSCISCHNFTCNASCKTEKGKIRCAKASKTWYQSEKGKRYYANRVLADRKQHLKRMYGLTLEQYEEMTKKQKDLCAICSKKVKLFVDHNHKTKKNRGLLCSTCNSILGFAKDNSCILYKAIEYLTMHK